jgi:hypothetical protein
VLHRAADALIETWDVIFERNFECCSLSNFGVKINRITSQTENAASSEFKKLQSYLLLPLDLNRDFKLAIHIGVPADHISLS